MIATTSVQKRKRASQVMYIGITSLFVEEGKKISASSETKEATAPLWYSYGLAPSILYHSQEKLSIIINIEKRLIFNPICAIINSYKEYGGICRDEMEFLHNK